MAHTLSLVDISPFIYSGYSYKPNVLVGPVTQRHSAWEAVRIPAGGVAFLFQKVSSLLRTDTEIVFCADRNASCKKSMFALYKGSRDYNKAVDDQCFVAESLLKDCGFQVLAEDGFESDDLIYSVWKDYQKTYDHFHLYVRDSDMHFMINNKTTIEPVNSKCKQITMANYETLAIPKQVIPYVGSCIYKIVFGCHTDEVPPLFDKGTNQRYWAYLERDPRLCYAYDKWMIKTIMRSYLAEQFYDRLDEQIDLIFPLYSNQTLDTYSPDTKKFAEWMAALNGSNKYGPSDRTKTFVVNLQEEMTAHVE